MLTKESKRINWIDMSKGIGIALVVLGHLFKYGSIPFRIVFACHMPLFFFLSGIFFNTYGYSFKRFIRKAIKSLVLPFVAFTVLGLIITLIIPSWRESLNTQQLFVDLYKMNPESFHVGQLWFLSALFWVKLMMWIVTFVFKNYDLRKVAISLFCLCPVMALLCIKCNRFFPMGRFPLMFDTVFMSLAFFSGGYIFKDYKERFYEFAKERSYLLVMPLIILYYILQRINGVVNISIPQYGDIYIYIFAALVGIFIIMFLSVKMSTCYLGVVFLPLGRNSLQLFSVHSFGIYLFCYLLKITGLETTAGVCGVSFFYSIIIGILICLILYLIGTVLDKIREKQCNIGPRNTQHAS